MEVVTGTAAVDLGVEHAAEGIDGGGNTGSGHAGVGDEGEVASKLPGMGLDVRGDRLAADLFFALDKDANVNRKHAVAGAHQRLEGLEESVHLALVVHGAAGIEAVA